MTMFTWILMGHLAGEFLLQSRWMAEGKEKDWAPLIVHAVCYTSAVFLFSLFAGGLKFTAVLIIFLAHVLLDRRAFVKWWARKFTGSNGTQWLIIMIDQSWHIVILALVTLL